MSFVDRIKKISRLKTFRFVALAAVGATVVSFLALQLLLSSDKPVVGKSGETNASSATSTEKSLLTSPLDGLPLAHGATSTRLFAVMIENHVDARPLSGLAAASLVFEAPVEGGITRLLAVFDSDRNASEIGPVRSARAYYLDWAGEFSAVYAHVGGSPEALDKIKAGDYFDLNEYWNGQYFWRQNVRAAPHNVYTSTDLLAQAAANRGWNAVADNFGAWRFEAPPAGAAATSTTEVAIPWSTPSYAVSWRFDPVNQRYLRFVAGAAASDKDGKRETAANVAVAFTDTSVYDEKGRLRVRTLGGGRAILFRDGQALEGAWRKEAVGERLRFYDQSGAEFVFRPGTTWVEVVPREIVVTYKNGGQKLALTGL